MRLPKLAIENYQFTIVIFILLTFAGVSSYLNMPRTENPEIYIPGASVTVIYPGASPVDMEQLVVLPLEESINELDDIVKISSTIVDGMASVTVEFSYETDADEKYDEVVQQVNIIKEDLPEDIYKIDLWRFSSSDVAMMQLALVSESLQYAEMEEKAEKLKKELERLNGVKEIEILACPNEEIRVNLDLEKMAALNISIDQVGNAIVSNNANIPGGDINVSDKNFRIKTSGALENLDEIKNSVVHSVNGSLIYLKDIAKVTFDYEDTKYIARYNGKRAIFVTIKQKEGLNIFQITDNITPHLEAFKNNNGDVNLKMVFDQSKIVDDRISGFLNNLFQGILVVGIVVLLAIGFRSAIIVMIAIPLSILIGLSFVNSYGLGLEQITIASLVVALGLLVDNSIVITENINRYISLGNDSKFSAIKGTSEIGWPIVSSTLTTLMAFIPIAMMPDKAGDFIKGLPVTIVATLSVSLLIALALSPLVAKYLFKGRANKSASKKKEFNFFERHLKRFSQGKFRKILSYALTHKAIVLSVLFVLLLCSGFVFRYVGVSFFPSAETPQFLIRINLPEDANLNKTDEVTRYVESVLDTIPEVNHYASNVGHGNPRVYYNVFTKRYAKNYADLYVQLKEYDSKQFYGLVYRLRDHFDDYPGAQISVKIFEQGIPTDAPVMVFIYGESLEVLSDIADEVEQKIKEHPGALNIENQLSKKKSDIYFNIHKEKANLLGVPIHEIDKTIRAAISGVAVSKFRDDDGQEYDIVLRMKEGENITLSDFEKIYVKSMTGQMIPVKQLAKNEFMEAPNLIKRKDLARTALITADLDNRYDIDEVLQPTLDFLKEYDFPVGYDYHIGGEIEARGETFGGMGRALVFAVIAIFAVLVLQFKSFTQPLIIFISFPLGLIGVVWALFISGYTFSFTAFVGFISLAGIVINNAIILVDYTNQIRREGKEVMDSLLEAASTRFTPIILTTLTTIGGLLPLTLKNSEMWSPMGWTIIGGLLVSTILTLIVVPIIYLLIEKVEN